VSFETLGRLLLVAGAVLLLVGALFFFLGRFGLERLPGDIVWRGGRTTVYVPLGLSIVLSLVLTIVLNLIFRR